MSLEQILLGILTLVAPALGGYFALQYAKSILPWLDTRKPVVKQIIFGVYGVAVAVLAPVLGFTLPDLGSFGDPAVVTGALTTILGLLIHKFFAPKTTA